MIGIEHFLVAEAPRWRVLRCYSSKAHVDQVQFRNHAGLGVPFTRLRCEWCGVSSSGGHVKHAMAQIGAPKKWCYVRIYVMIDLAMTTFTDLPGWIFECVEVSAGVFRAYAMDAVGRSVDITGVDPDALMEHCRQFAIEILGRS